MNVNVSIAHADALEVDPDFWANFDHMVCDPPYSEHVHANPTSVGVLGGSGMGVHARPFGFDHLSPELRARIATIASKVQRWSVVFSDLEGCHEWRDAMARANVEYLREVPWIRWSQPQLSGDRPPSGCEATLWFHRQHVGAKGGVKPVRKRWNGPGSLTHLERRCLRGKDKHAAEKPLDLALDLVSWVSDPGESIVDPTCGRGTTILACRLLERNGLGLERDADEAIKAQARIRNPLSDRDRVRAREWVEATRAAASRVPEPKADDGSDVKTYERAQRRLADAARVEANL